MEKRRSMWAPWCGADGGVVGLGWGVSAVEHPRGLREAQD